MKKFFLLNLIAAFFMASGCVQPSAAIPNEDSTPETHETVGAAVVMIYGGPGSWKNEIAALKKILLHQGVSYHVLTPVEMNNLSVDDYAKFNAVIFTGGDAPTVRKSLSVKTRANLRDAVKIRGVNYLGFCAGAWLAVAPAPAVGEDVIYGLGVVSGPLQDYNFLYKQGRSHAVDESLFPDGSKRKLLWYGGPVTPSYPNSVIAKYSDGTAAISQIRSGKGLVVISGLHPAMTKGMLKNLGIHDIEISAPAFAWELLQAVIFEKTLPTFP